VPKPCQSFTLPSGLTTGLVENQLRSTQSRLLLSPEGALPTSCIITTTSPASTTAAMARNFVATKNLFRRVLALVLMQFATLTSTTTPTLSSLCVHSAAPSVMPRAVYMLSTKTMLRMARVAGITATIHVHAARKPKTSPKQYLR